MNKCYSLLRRIVGRVKKMNSDTIYGGMGIAFIAIGFSFSALSIGTNNTGQLIASVVFILIGLSLFTYAYNTARRNERKEQNTRFLEYKNVTKMILEIVSELKQSNENFNNLINELRHDR